MKSPAVASKAAEQKVLNDANDPSKTDPPVITLDEDEDGTMKVLPIAKENMGARRSPRKHSQTDQKQEGRKTKQWSLFDMMKKAGSKRKTPSETPPKAGEKSADTTPKKEVEKDDKTEEQASKRPKKEPEVQVDVDEEEEENPAETSVVESDADETLNESAISTTNADVDMKSDNSEDDCDDVSEVMDTSDSQSQEAKKEGAGEEKNSAKKPGSATRSATKSKKPKKTDPAAEKAKEERRLERERKQKQKEEEKRQKEEERKKREEERKQKEEEKKRLKEEKERKRKEEEEEREKRRKEKEEQKEKERLEKEAKLKAKEEELKKRDEEKRKQEEAKQKEEEAKAQKQQKQAQAFAKFFKKVDTSPAAKGSRTPSGEDKKPATSSFFKPFPLKDNMRLAPCRRAEIGEKRKKEFDETFKKQGRVKDQLYLKELKKGVRKPGKSVATFPAARSDGLEEEVQIVEADEDDKIIIGTKIGVAPGSSQESVRCRAKLLAFEENRRPAYWGTWRKKSKAISGRRPFAADTIFFDYDVDSDDEWEDEDDNAESLKGNSDDDKESEDDYEIDNEFFVPHGYLSDGEGSSDEEAGVEAETSDEPEAKEKKLKLKMAEFEEERKRKTTRLQPILIGPLWHGSDAANSATIKQHPNYSRWVAHLEPMEALLCLGNPDFVFTSFNPPPVESKGSNGKENGVDDREDGDVGSEKKKRGKAKMYFPEEAVGLLAKFVHGSCKKRSEMAPEFNDSWVRELALKEMPIKSIPKIRIVAKIKEIAAYNHAKQMWLVKDEVLANFPDVKLPEPPPAPAGGATPGGGASPNDPSTSTGNKRRGKPRKSEPKKIGVATVEKKDDGEGDTTPTKGKTPKKGPLDLFLGKAKKIGESAEKKVTKGGESDECVVIE